MNRAEVIRQILLWEQVAEQAQQKAAQFRAMLQADAVAELEEQGTTPTWRLPDIASVSLSVSRTAPVVRDEEALAKWVSLVRPDEVGMRVRPSYLAALKRSVRVDGDVVVDRDGTVVPGMEVRPGGQPLAVRVVPEPAAKDTAEQAASVVVDRVAAGLGLPAVDEEVSDAEA